MTQTQTEARWARVVTPSWLEDDTEESVVGTEWHQEAIGALAATLRTVARRRAVSWGVCEQFQIVGLRKASGEEYSPRPDVMVLPHEIDKSRSGLPVADIATPLFILEVASSSTATQDLVDKARVYAQLGVVEYVVFDPDGAVLGGPVRAWRLASPSDALYTPWLPDAQGCLVSAALDITVEATQPLLSVRDRDGRVIETLADTQARLESLEQELRTLRGG